MKTSVIGRAIKKTTAGLLKLLHSHLNVEEVREHEMVPVAEMRKRTTDQLGKVVPAE